MHALFLYSIIASVYVHQYKVAIYDYNLLRLAIFLNKKNMKYSCGFKMNLIKIKFVSSQWFSFRLLFRGILKILVYLSSLK
jgi:hypothetical protein